MIDVKLTSRQSIPTTNGTIYHFLCPVKILGSFKIICCYKIFIFNIINFNSFGIHPQYSMLYVVLLSNHLTFLSLNICRFKHYRLTLVVWKGGFFVDNFTYFNKFLFLFFVVISETYLRIPVCLIPL